MPVLADDEVVVHRDAKRACDLHDRLRHLDVGARRRLQISFSAFRLACPSFPTMRWSCTAIPSARATSTIACVIWISARDGVGSPEGWLCKSKSRELAYRSCLTFALERYDRGRALGAVRDVCS